MADNIFFSFLPYVAFALAIAGGVYRYFADGFSYSSLSSRFLEDRESFWGSVPWHYTIVIILLGHLFGGLFPEASAFLLRGPARLFISEWIGLSLGFLAVMGMIILIIRRLGHSQVLAETSVTDWILIAALTAQVVAGTSMALAYRWGSLWYLDTAVPWFRSIAAFRPEGNTINPLPLLVKFHMVNAFVIIALFPFTRLAHIFAVPVSYLWRPFQVVIWNRRAAPRPGEAGAAAGLAAAPVAERYAPAAAGGPVQISRRGFLAIATGVLTGFVVLVAGIPFIGGLVGPIYREKKRHWIKVKDITSLPLGQPINPTFSMQVVQAYIREVDLRKVWVIKHSSTEVTVFSPICPHLGCHYHWDPQTHHFECPCHGSVYTLAGKVIGGPAPRPLDTLPWKLEGETLFIQWEEFKVGTPEKIPV
jgi:nitrate reductase gamma subunit